jgi:transcriptional regulator with XRE-family HTH domain
MPNHLAHHFQEARLARGFSLGQVARLAGYQNVSKGCNRIHHFERSGSIDRELLRKLATVLEINEATIKELAERDQRAFLDDWNRWVNEPIQPFLVLKMIPAVYSRRTVPDDLRTIEDAEAWASSVAAANRQKCCLVWSRRISCWFTEDGSLSHRSEAVPGELNMPLMQMPASKGRFLFGESPRIE